MRKLSSRHKLMAKLSVFSSVHASCTQPARPPNPIPLFYIVLTRFIIFHPTCWSQCLYVRLRTRGLLPPQCWIIHRAFSLDHSSRGTATLILQAHKGEYIIVFDLHYILHLPNQLVHMLRQNTRATQTQRSTTLNTVDWTAR